jgi:hypothetical protein
VGGLRKTYRVAKLKIARVVAQESKKPVWFKTGTFTIERNGVIKATMTHTLATNTNATATASTMPTSSNNSYWF